MEGSVLSKDVSLIEVRRAAAKGNVFRTYGELECIVVGFEATVPHPNRYLYPGCSVDVGYGRACAKSVRGDKGCPNHHLLPDATSELFYRFDLFLADSSLGKRNLPIRATLFGATEDLLGMSATSFSTRNKAQQDRIVKTVMKTWPSVAVTLSVRGGLVAVGSLTVDHDAVETLPSYSRQTPPSRTRASNTPTVFTTPPSQFTKNTASSSGSSGSSSSKGMVSRQELQKLRKKFDELMNRGSIGDDDLDETSEVIVLSD